MSILITIMITLFISTGSRTMESEISMEPVNPCATKEARELLEYLYSIKGKKILSGQHNYSIRPSASSDAMKLYHDERVISLEEHITMFSK